MSCYMLDRRTRTRVRTARERMDKVTKTNRDTAEPSRFKSNIRSPARANPWTGPLSPSAKGGENETLLL